ncbi:transglycosylase domain-containing protein [Micrococcus luteus]|uniref:transglycosylase domain-containing protein n=1 Tax=Micrococcus luteus TaxID=1270 RepID=UPI003D330794
MASRTTRFPAPSSALGRLLAFVGLSAVAGLLVAALLLPVAGLTGVAAASGREMLDELPDELPAEPVSVPSRILSEDGEEIAVFYEENRTPVPLDEISEHMQHAIVAIEDERFYDHDGVDARGLIRATVNNATSDSTQGASTLTQQFVNNMLVNVQQIRGDSRLTLSGSKNIADKVKEIKLAVAVEKQMSKDEILEGYLNIVLFSGRAYGVEAASQYVFGKSAADLESWEAATLAGMVQSPTRFNPARNPEEATERRNLVLNAMKDNGYLSQEEYDHAVAQPMEVVMESRPSGCLYAKFGTYFCDYVERQILADPTFGPDVQSRQALLDRGGLTIRTTIDSTLQKETEKNLRASVPNNESLGAGHALTSVEAGTGNIRTMAQNTEYAIQDELGHTSLNFNVDKQWGGGQGFQAGSTLKPFVALTWLRNGNRLVDSVDASRNVYPTGTRFAASCRPGGYTTIGGTWQFKNVIPNMLRQVRVDEGLFWSVNTPTVATAYQLDLCDITSLTTQLGITRALDSSPLQPDDPSFLLGKDSVAPLSLAGAYAAIAANGLYCEPRAILEVTDTAGNQYDVADPQCDQVIDPDHVRELMPVLRHIGGFNIAEEGAGYEFGGKTGTNDNVSSTWFVGFTSKLATAVWTGRYNNLKSMTGETVNGEVRNPFYSTSINGPSWLEYNQLAKEKFPPGELPEWDGPQSEDPGEAGEHPDGRQFTIDDLDRGGPQPQAVPGF